MQQSFCFVNGRDVDRLTKKKMRRHVMIGKNAGKTVHRRSRKELGRAEKAVVKPLEVRAVQGYRRRSLEHYQPASLYHHVFAGLSFPVELTPHFAGIISNFLLFIADKIYPVALGISIETSKYTWMKVIMSDEAAFYCNIALMQACNELFLGGGEDSPTAMYHLSTSLKYVRERLEGDDALADSTLGLVISLITQEQVRGQRKAARVHMDGLVGMIEVRGGLEALGGSLPLLLKTCKTDIMFTLEHEGPPRFFRNNMVNLKEEFRTLGVPFDTEKSRELVQHTGLSPALLRILIDVISASTLFNDFTSTSKIDLFLYQEIIISILYRIFAIPFHQDTSLPPTIEDAYHVGLTLFMMTLFLQHGRERMLQYHNITKRLRDVLDSNVLDEEYELKFWLLMMEGVWVSQDDGAEWLPLVVRGQARKLGLRGWEDARRVLKRYPWIHLLHDGPGIQVWKKAERN